jgi:membrane protease YdiL (CAAX protease family)
MMKKHITTAIKVIAFFVLWGAIVSIIMGITPIAEPVFLSGNNALLRLWWEIIPLLCVLLITIVFVLVVEKKKVCVPLLKNPLKDTALGLILGFVWLAGVILPLFLLGNLTLGEKHTVSYLWIWFISALLNAAMQEYLIRGYLLVLLKDKYNIFVAVIITTIIFTAMHGGAFEAGAIAVFNVISMSVFVSLLLVYTKSLLAAILVHFIWNGVGCMIFGIVSLAGDYPSLWNGVLSGDSFISGGAAKLEGSIVVSIVNLLLIIFMGYKIKRRSKQV